MDCKKMRDRLLAEYPDKELGSVENAEAGRHLTGCADCREFYSVLQKAAVAPFREAKEIQPDEVVWRRIQERIESEKQHAGGWFERLADHWVPLLRMPQPVFRAAFVTALILVTVVLTQWPSRYVADPVYGYMAEQMAFMKELRAGNPDLLTGDPKDKEYETAFEEMGG
jgi:hypothetical protein